MKIDLTDLLKETGNTREIKEQADLSFPEDGLKAAGPVRLDIRFLNAGGIVLVTGKAAMDAELACDRCLKSFKKRLEVDIDEKFGRDEPKDQESAEKETGLEDEDFVYPIDADNTIDLAEVIRQELISGMPIRSLCSADCKGIEGYKKESKKTDPRLQKLKEEFYNARTQKKTQQHKDEPKKKG